MRIRTWDDVDAALAEIGKRQAAIAEARAQVDAEKAEIEELAERMEAWVRDHEEDLQERSKSLDHGRVWLRLATRLAARSWDKVVGMLLAAGMDGLVRIKHEADKEALATLPDERLASFGVRRKIEDKFGYEATG